MMRANRKYTWRYFAICLALALASWLLMFTDTLTQVELVSLDARFLLRSLVGRRVLGEANQGGARIVVVAVDSESLAELGSWPWPRSRHAELIRILGEAGVKAVGFDIIFAEPSTAAEDRSLAESLAGEVPVLLPIVVEATDRRTALWSPVLYGDHSDLRVNRLTSPLDDFAKQAELGHIGILPDRDGIVRSIPSFINDVPAFSLQLAKLAGLDPESTAQIPEWFVVNFPSASGVYSLNSLFPIVSYHDVLAGRFNPALFEGSIVLVGSTAPGLQADFLPTALRLLGYMPGVLLQAAATETILAQRFISPFPSGLGGMLCLASVSALLAGFLFQRGRPLQITLRFILAILGIFGLAVMAFQRGIWLLIIGPILFPLGLCFIAALIKGQLSAERAREQIKNTFTRYVPPSVLTRLLENPAEVALGGKERHVTVFFADFRGFTAFTEGAPAKQVVEVLNQAFSRLVPIIEAHAGVVDKFLGDAVMAVFGAPVALPRPEEAGVKAALAILAHSAKTPTFPIGIGLAAGTVVAGNVGTEERLNYTVVGHAVNTAARLEKLAGAGELIITAEVYAKLEPALQQLFSQSDLVNLKGLSSPTKIYIYKEGVLAGGQSGDPKRTTG